MWWHGHSGNWGGWWALAWVCWMLVLWGGLGALAVFLVRRWRRWRPAPGTSPEDILAERYARGEISTEEYHERLEVLRQQRG
ncbi:MAG TPA: SHOCT domain-containing protein [Streptosporangiaceae bacterium]|jgi:putative membrane protein